MTDGAKHWEGVYTTRPLTELSWYEREPAASLRLVRQVATGPSAAVVDVGAGASRLVDHLLGYGFGDVTVLDLSQRALAEVRARLGERARDVTFVQQDVLTWEPVRQYDVWHDRAVFHFLTERVARDRYVEAAARTVRAGGSLVLATFAEDGPTQCSGLPVERYSAQGLDEVFAGSFSLVEHERHEHVTPGGTVQPFSWVVLRRHG